MSLPMAESPDSPDREDKFVLLSKHQQRQRRARSIAIALVLAALVVIFYLVTIAKLGPGVVDRPL